ncbi:MAG TPA: C2H2-type zinc finger protein [Phycisphaerae bacterium]|nr:C2H2-type zinc finger protein [Phycisphaerae bacterium]HRY71509.1 C2H2-type zinc finger protein [Phycisphaerae bacterium]HSA30071.1 C2H2-type zinc finger protein [Phycisphaerae bacterium]
MRRKKTGFKCTKCGKSFKMAMHLGRHMKTTHGQAKPLKATRDRKPAAREGRPAAGIASLKDLSLDQLVGLIAAAKAEASRRMTELRVLPVSLHEPC